jgi:hypothetical protein
LEDVEVVDGEPVAASLIARAVTARELLFDDGATQRFDVNGDTSYVEADGRPTQGKWYVDEEGRFCSFWPPTYRACYGLLWIVEGDEIVGLSFTELGRGTRFDGRSRRWLTGPARDAGCPRSRPPPGQPLARQPPGRHMQSVRHGGL